MPIQLLAPQLINQIAAGEIVERPASVVKELLENSLDAGATRIEVDIEQGGVKCIRIRDNGAGIPKDELPLALARHATSKIATLEDLERILSLGFRGEALASISSIARLSLTSSVGEPAGAWLVYVEGREMSVTLQPAAHPRGTTVEVLDLFFNTPARRHFLKTERTEFAHIDEVVKKVALARYDVEVILKHNAKVIRHYRSVNHLADMPQRIATVSGKLFVESGISVTWQQADLELAGWVLAASACTPQLEMQYCYVNGRITKDKLLMHAVRQAYQEFIGETYPGYILYLTLPADKVDVNVHPTKQEVRFHESRLVHDFVYQAVLNALNSATNRTLTTEASLIEPTESDSVATTTVDKAAPDKWQAFRQQYQRQALSNEQQQAQQLYQQMLPSEPETSRLTTQLNEATPSYAFQTLFPIRDNQQLFSPNEPSTIASNLVVAPEPSSPLPYYASITPLGRVLTVYQGQYAIIEYLAQLQLLNMEKAERCCQLLQLQQQIQTSKQETLLLPLSWEATLQEQQGYQTQLAYNGLTTLGIECTLSNNKISIAKVPLLLRRCPLQPLISGLLNDYSTQLEPNNTEVLEYLVGSLASKKQWTQSEAIQLVTQLELHLTEANRASIQALLIPIDLQSIIKQLAI